MQGKKCLGITFSYSFARLKQGDLLWSSPRAWPVLHPQRSQMCDRQGKKEAAQFASWRELCEYAAIFSSQWYTCFSAMFPRESIPSSVRPCNIFQPVLARQSPTIKSNIIRSSRMPIHSQLICSGPSPFCHLYNDLLELAGVLHALDHLSTEAQKAEQFLQKSWLDLQGCNHWIMSSAGGYPCGSMEAIHGSTISFHSWRTWVASPILTVACSPAPSPFSLWLWLFLPSSVSSWSPYCVHHICQVSYPHDIASSHIMLAIIQRRWILPHKCLLS